MLDDVDDGAGTPWIPDPAERDNLRKDLEWALEQDAKLMEHHFGVKPKRVVHYNPEAVLCRACQKRIRLNKNGRLRMHISGKVGSSYCMLSNTEPFPEPIDHTTLVNKAVDPKPLPDDVFQKGDRVWDQPPLFSDPV